MTVGRVARASVHLFRLTVIVVIILFILVRFVKKVEIFTTRLIGCMEIVMFRLIPAIILIGLSAQLSAQNTDREESVSLWEGNLYTRAAYSYQHADDYHSGYGSTASSVFDNSDGSYTFHNYSLDFVYVMRSGVYFGSGLYASSADVSTDGLGTGTPDTDTGFDVREIPIAVGYETSYEDLRLRVEGRFMINVDNDFNRSLASALDSRVLLPVTDGSDSFALSFRGKKAIAGFEHTLLLGYQIYENGVEHPIFTNFSLGDRFFVDYEISKVFGDLKLGLGHVYSQSQQTDGDYLVEKPRFSEIRASATYRFTPRLLGDCGFKYYYDGKDAPKQKTVYLGIAYIF